MNWSTEANDMAVKHKVNEGLLREGCAMRRGLPEGKVGFVLDQSEKRETTGVLRDTRFKSDWNMYDVVGLVDGS